MLSRDRHHVLLEVPHALVIAESLFAANLLFEQKSLVGGGQALMHARHVPRFLERDDGQGVATVLLVEQRQRAQRLDRACRSAAAFGLQLRDAVEELILGVERGDLELGLSANGAGCHGSGRGGYEEPIRGRAHRSAKGGTSARAVQVNRGAACAAPA